MTSLIGIWTFRLALWGLVASMDMGATRKLAIGGATTAVFAVLDRGSCNPLGVNHVRMLLEAGCFVLDTYVTGGTGMQMVLAGRFVDVIDTLWATTHIIVSASPAMIDYVKTMVAAV